jgi:hypothetical protein
VVATRDLGDHGLDRCHDSQSAAAHALSISSDIGEAWASCHDPGKACGVEKVHARQYGQTRQDRILPTNETGRFGALSCLGAASAK